MVQTRAQRRREDIWNRMENAPLPDHQPFRNETSAAAYSANDISHRHRLPDTKPFDTVVVTHKRRKPLH
jgi:hypothetical protein